MLACLFTLLVFLLPVGATPFYDDLRTVGFCDDDMTFVLGFDGDSRALQVLVPSPAMRYVIPLPPAPPWPSVVRISYRLNAEYAYLGSCRYGLKPYQYPDSVCQRVMVRRGPLGFY